MPRLRKADPLRNWTVRLSDGDIDQLARDAQRAGMPVARLARTRLRSRGEPAPAVASLPAEGQRLAAAMLADQLRRIGVNLNQLVRHVNQHPDERVPADAALILGQIRELVRQARAL